MRRRSFTTAGGRPKIRKEPYIVISVSVPVSIKQRWKQVAGDQALSPFIAEAVNSYIADIEEEAAA